MKRTFFLFFILVALLVYCAFLYFQLLNKEYSQQLPSFRKMSNISSNSLPKDGDSVLGAKLEQQFASYELPVIEQIHLTRLLRARDYNAMEELIQGYFNEFDKDVRYEGKIIGAFDIFDFEEDILDETTEWVEKFPKSPYARLARGGAYYRLGWKARGSAYASNTWKDQFDGMHNHFEKAEEDLKEALEFNPKLSPAYFLLLNMAAARGFKDEQYYWYTEAIKNIPYSYNIRWNHLYHLLPRWGGTYEEMENFVAIAQMHAGDNPRLLLLKSYIPYFRASDYRGSKEYEKSIIEITKSIDYVKRWYNYYDRARSYKYLGENELALQDINAALKARPNVHDSLLVKGSILRNLKRYEEALALYEHAISLYPNKHKMYEYRGTVYWKLKQHQMAENDYLKALELNPMSAYSWTQKGILNHYHLNNSEQALSDLTTSFSIDFNPDTWYEYSSVLWYIKDPEAVEAYYAFLNMCHIETCNRDQLNWAKKFIACIENDSTCTWKPEFYKAWVN